MEQEMDRFERTPIQSFIATSSSGYARGSTLLCHVNMHLIQFQISLVLFTVLT